MADISGLSADELLTELRKFGLKVGPITPTTRRIFEKRLAKARGEEKRAPDIEEISVIKTFEDDDKPDGDSMSSEIKDEKASNVSPLFYYGVCFDRCNDDGNTNLEPAVYTSQEKALQAVKQHRDKNARFKPFKTREEAERFSIFSFSSSIGSPASDNIGFKKGVEAFKQRRDKSSRLYPFKTFDEAERLSLSCNSNSLVTSPGSGTLIQQPVDPTSNYKKPTPQELVKFRKIIEHGDSQEVLNTVTTNPKYLISSGDTPVVLQEGFRYNAMHIAAKENKPEMCRLIMDTIESDTFWHNYPSLQTDTRLKQMNNKRKQFLVDLYLNTPDKGNFETPLHFACKFGHVDVVRYLVSHPLTNITPRNRYGDTPEQVTCSRCSSQTGSFKIMEEIKHLLEDNHFVPVFGSEGDATPPRIGEPWSPDIHNDYRLPSCSGSSPAEPKVTVRAFAGPMSPSKATEFHHQWKTPPTTPEERKKYDDMRRGDSARGIERIGRNLAHTQNIPWAEYWHFLGSYFDLSQPSGLQRLEEYLSSQLAKRQTSWAVGREQPGNAFFTPVSMKSDSVFMEEHEMDFTHSSSNNMPLLPLHNLKDSKDIPHGDDEIAEQLSRLDLEDNTSHSHCSSSESPDRILSTNVNTKDNDLFLCKKNLLAQINEMDIDKDSIPTRTSNIEKVESVDGNVDERLVPLQSSSDPEVAEKSDSEITPPSKQEIKSDRSSTESSDSVFHERREDLLLFINGSYPTKTDLDVLRALGGITISRDTYPQVAGWRDRVLSYTTTTRESWPSPGSPLCRTRYKSMLPMS